MGASTNEKITDGARGLYEKTTGYVIVTCTVYHDEIILTSNRSKVNPKYSN